MYFCFVINHTSKINVLFVFNISSSINYSLKVDITNPVYIESMLITWKLNWCIVNNS